MRKRAKVVQPPSGLQDDLHVFASVLCAEFGEPSGAVFERGDTVNRLGHLQLNDHASVYRLGTGTNALDGNPNLAGVQANGPGMRQIVVNANGLRSWFDLGGKLHDDPFSASADGSCEMAKRNSRMTSW